MAACPECAASRAVRLAACRLGLRSCPWLCGEISRKEKCPSPFLPPLPFPFQAPGPKGRIPWPDGAPAPGLPGPWIYTPRDQVLEKEEFRCE